MKVHNSKKVSHISLLENLYHQIAKVHSAIDPNVLSKTTGSSSGQTYIHTYISTPDGAPDSDISRQLRSGLDMYIKAVH